MCLTGSRNTGFDGFFFLVLFHSGAEMKGPDVTPPPHPPAAAFLFFFFAVPPPLLLLKRSNPQINKETNALDSCCVADTHTPDRPTEGKDSVDGRSRKKKLFIFNTFKLYY